jgi:hypothetical protein
MNSPPNPNAIAPTEAEVRALGESGPLVRFAAERLDNLDPALTLSIAESLEAKEQGNWTPQASQKFWSAFGRLCVLIRPTTMDALSASNRDIEPRTLWFKKKEKVSLAQRVSARYLWGLGIAIAVTLPLQLYVWSGTIESKKIDDTLENLRPIAASLTDDYGRVNAEAPVAGSSSPWKPEAADRADKLRQSAQAFALELGRLHYEATILQRLTLRSAPPNMIIPADAAWFDAYSAAMNIYGATKLAAVKAQEDASLAVGIVLSFILPLLFGVIGAIAYVIRSISNEISSTTFSKTSPIRHLMRVTLGALAGVVVGFFTNVSSHIALPPLALAFLAGYGVEPLFSMFDGFIAKFKQ